MNFIPRPNTKTRYVVAIDPDLQASGVAAWCNITRTWLFAKSISIECILESLNGLDPKETTIYIECGWLNKKSNFRKTSCRAVSENIAMKVGQNHATGKIIIKILESAGYTINQFKPLKKGIFKDLTGWTRQGRDYIQKESGLIHRINDDVRDAIFIILHFR